MIRTLQLNEQSSEAEPQPTPEDTGLPSELAPDDNRRGSNNAPLAWEAPSVVNVSSKVIPEETSKATTVLTTEGKHKQE